MQSAVRSTCNGNYNLGSGTAEQQMFSIVTCLEGYRVIKPTCSLRGRTLGPIFY